VLGVKYDAPSGRYAVDATHLRDLIAWDERRRGYEDALRRCAERLGGIPPPK